MRRLGAHCLVVVMKRGNARGAKGVGHQRWIGSTGNGRNPIINGRRQPSLGGTSRMMREYHVQICEGLGVKFPGSTRHSRRFLPRACHVRLSSKAHRESRPGRTGSLGPQRSSEPLAGAADSDQLRTFWSSVTLERHFGLVYPMARTSLSQIRLRQTVPPPCLCGRTRSVTQCQRPSGRRRCR